MNNSGFDTTAPSAAGPVPAVDVRTYLRILWRWKWIFLVVVIVIPVGVYLKVSRDPKVYQSTTALLEVQPVAGNASQLSTGGAPSSAQVLSAVAQLMTTTAVADQAAKLLPPPPANPSSLAGSVTATPDVNTGFISVTATASTPARAAAIANAFSAAVAVTRARQAIASLNNAIAQATQELNSLPVHDKGARQPLISNIQQDRALRTAQGSNAQIVQPAMVNSTAISPHVTRAVTLALVAALLVGLAAVALAESSDRRLREADDLEALTGRPLLSIIPKSAFSGDLPTPAEAEAFRTLHTTLTYFNVDRPRSTIVVSSPSKGDGKTTVATQLAIAAARGGGDVILVDADLRHPQVTGRLEMTGQIGVEAVLAGRGRLEDALKDYELHPKPREGRLRILPALEVPPNPAQLLASQRMRQLLETLSNMSDSVIIDTSPALMVADALPLFEAASGVLLVARVNRTHKESIRRLHWTIENSGGTILGTVATDADARGPYGKYAYAYGEVASKEPGADDSGGPSTDSVPAGRLATLFRRNKSKTVASPGQTASK